MKLQKIIPLVILIGGVFTAKAQQPQVSHACITNIIVYSVNGSIIGIGYSTNQYIQVSSPGYDLISYDCSPDRPSAVPIRFSLGCCPTSSVTVGTISAQCDSSLTCIPGQYAHQCDSGYSVDIVVPAHHSSVDGVIWAGGGGCCAFEWCPFTDVWCDGQGWPPCNITYTNTNTSYTNYPPNNQ